VIPELLVERDGAIATVTINRPEKLNALTKPLWGALGEAVRTLDQDESVRCLVLRGAGEKAFGPGNDIGRPRRRRANTAS
jgi:enoyl-CoA hydratase